ncbi:uncharacterized protein KGF55_000441 [Candida pseudojiufengensis]|uniref:uncharacterized protein n=1 Tax=Candida pseudojiufengensis TaxID=497109 RepID=UPI0022257C3A|nr:uncharacterized protein KGF55_000441 [Candida pseudojiufengensis]KAI5967031.1 hypothetical protein KGF55_000441 [Candida pseudojiufengensis]
MWNNSNKVEKLMIKLDDIDTLPVILDNGADVKFIHQKVVEEFKLDTVACDPFAVCSVENCWNCYIEPLLVKKISEFPTGVDIILPGTFIDVDYFLQDKGEVVEDKEEASALISEKLLKVGNKEKFKFDEEANAIFQFKNIDSFFKHEIWLKDKSKAPMFDPYKVANHLKTEMDKQMDELLDACYIRYSQSAFSSPSFFVPKPNNKFGLVIDYR